MPVSENLNGAVCVFLIIVDVAGVAALFSPG